MTSATVAAMDLTERQQQFADAALAIVAREGMAAVSFRTVAAEAGWSLGALQKAFATRRELEQAMLHQLRTSPGLMPIQPPGQPTVQAWLSELFWCLLPVHEASRRATLIGSAFADRAAHDPELAAVIAAGDAELHGLITALVARARRQGEIDPGLDDQTIAWAYVALLQGASAQVLYSRIDHDSLAQQSRDSIAALMAPRPN